MRGLLQAGLLAALLSLSALVSGCGAGGYAGGGIASVSASVVTIDAAQSMTVSANVTGNLPVSWTFSGASCGTNCGTLSSATGTQTTYTAPASVSAPFQVTLQAAINGTTNARTVTINVNPAPAIGGTPPSGTAGVAYSFTFTTTPGTSPLKLSLLSGSFPAGLTFDASTGVITAGEQDSNGQGSFPNGTTVETRNLLGTYTIGNDRRGSLTLTSFNADGSVYRTRTYAIALRAPVSPATTSAQGSLIEFDDANLAGTRGSGTLLQQSATAITAGLSGSYPFRMQGGTPCLPSCTIGIVAGPVASVGRFTAAGGSIRAAAEDAMIGPTQYSNGTVSGSYTAADTNGRVQLTRKAATGRTGGRRSTCSRNQAARRAVSDVAAGPRKAAGEMENRSASALMCFTVSERLPFRMSDTLASPPSSVMSFWRSPLLCIRYSSTSAAEAGARANRCCS